MYFNNVVDRRTRFDLVDLIQTNESIDKKRKKIEKWCTWLWRIRERGRKRENRCFYSSTIVRNWRRARSRRHLLRNSSITAGGAIFTSGKEQWWIREGRRKKERKKFVLKMFRGGKGRLFPRGIEVKANKIREWNSPRLLFLRIRSWIEHWNNWREKFSCIFKYIWEYFFQRVLWNLLKNTPSKVLSSNLFSF